VGQHQWIITDVKDLSERLKWARERANLTQLGLAEKARVSPGTIGNLETSARKSPRELLAIASALGVRPEWLKTGRGGPFEQQGAINLTENPDYPAVRRVRFKLSAGASGFAVEYPDDDDAPIVFRRQWFDSNGYDPEKLFAVRVANGSMEPGLNDGDTVVVNTAQTNPKDGVVFAVNYEGELVIKRLVRDAGQWWLCSDNADQNRYPRKVCHEGTFIVGEIVHKQSEKI
jgi:phage repressor protein C with HTH and peptisase S24 domain